MGDHGLARRNIERSSLMADAKPPVENDGVLLKLRGLSRLLPACGAAHVRHTDAIFLRIHAANVFVDDLGQVACRLDAGCCSMSVGKIVLLINGLAGWLRLLQPEIRDGKKSAKDEIAGATKGNDERHATQH